MHRCLRTGSASPGDPVAEGMEKMAEKDATVAKASD